MLWSERYVQDHKRQTDRAIHRAGMQLALDPLVFETFHALLRCARERATRLFEAPVVDGRHLGVDALVHLARFQDAHIRPAADWVGTTSSWRRAVSSLAHHLLCRYDVPVFLAAAWYANDPAGDEKRRWFVAHSRGASFRSLKLPMSMTRKMEHIFLASRDHLPIEQAMRRAELVALGTPLEFVEAILSTRLATDLRHGEFWRTVWMFLNAHAGDIEAAEIGPMIDFIQAVRHEAQTMETPQGRVRLTPLQPTFSMKGRTVQSMLRLMQNWHRSLGSGVGGYSWARSPFEPLLIEEPVRDDEERPRRWQILELTDSSQLRREGAALHHCVASYGGQCYRGSTSIWSIRLWKSETVHSMLTVEVDLKRRAVVQARGRLNRVASGRSLQLLHDWAMRERLRMDI